MRGRSEGEELKWRDENEGREWAVDRVQRHSARCATESSNRTCRIQLPSMRASFPFHPSPSLSSLCSLYWALSSSGPFGVFSTSTSFWPSLSLFLSLVPFLTRSIARLAMPSAPGCPDLSTLSTLTMPLLMHFNPCFLTVSSLSQ